MCLVDWDVSHLLRCCDTVDDGIEFTIQAVANQCHVTFTSPQEALNVFGDGWAQLGGRRVVMTLRNMIEICSLHKSTLLPTQLVCLQRASSQPRNPSV